MQPERTPPPVVDEHETQYRLHRRFDRIGRLVGDTAMSRLFGSHVLVVGLGGVGSFAVEALARSGIGRLTLVDFDRVCVTNTNRQLQALSTNVARGKAQLLCERARLINPQCEARPVPLFYSARTADEILGERPDYVVDAIDNVTAKCHLIATCRARGLPVVSSTGASGRLDPTRIRVADLAETRVDPLADAVRRALRQKYDFPARGPFGIAAVYSEEPPAQPHDLHYDGGEGFRCVCPGGTNDFHSCEERRVIYGTAAFVTGTFGLTCASVVVRALTTPDEQTPG
ncbi:MAG TPA: tRNA threonylcarbamoyladenosine dehydratase [Polyangia bacterium]|jgi:tRNA A37 threonylcarbamoyladenosine dehydratase|nr:tRNA threonylcarbamoyladenosine dehydratase [Polyangia bacterium]